MRKRGARRKHHWPFQGEPVPAAFGMSQQALVQLQLILRESMNAIHTAHAGHSHIQTVLLGLVLGLKVARTPDLAVDGLAAGREAIAEGVRVAHHVSARCFEGHPASAVHEEARMSMERALRVVEQLHQVAPRRFWLAAYQEAADPAGLQVVLADELRFAEGLAAC